jgi:hypothetical protein
MAKAIWGRTGPTPAGSRSTLVSVLNCRGFLDHPGDFLGIRISQRNDSIIEHKGRSRKNSLGYYYLSITDINDFDRNLRVFLLNLDGNGASLITGSAMFYHKNSQDWFHADLPILPTQVSNKLTLRKTPNQNEDFFYVGYLILTDIAILA